MTNASLQSLLNNSLGIIKNSLVFQKFKLSVPYTNSTQPVLSRANALVYENLGQFPLILKSLFFSYGSTFLSGYSIFVKLNGLNIDNNAFTSLPAGSSGFDYVPSGSEGFLIPAGSVLEIYAYNSGGATSNGIVNLLAVFDRLDAYGNGN